MLRPGTRKGDIMMAYLQLDTPQAGPAPHVAAPVHFTPKFVEVDDFSPFEWSIVALASAEPMSSLRGPGIVASLLSGLFGIRTSAGLADPRLEALRRMAVLAWHDGYSVPTHEVNAFHAAGFNVAQYETLQTRIGRERAARNSKRFR